MEYALLVSTLLLTAPKASPALYGLDTHLYTFPTCSHLSRYKFGLPPPPVNSAEICKSPTVRPPVAFGAPLINFLVGVETCSNFSCRNCKDIKLLPVTSSRSPASTIQVSLLRSLAICIIKWLISVLPGLGLPFFQVTF